MKKKFLLIVSLILAFVLSLTLIACGGGNIDPGSDPNPGNNKPDPDKPTQPFTMQKAADAINAFAGAGAVAGSVKLRIGEGATATSVELPFDRRDSKVKVTLPSVAGLELISGMDLLLDLDNGNAYMSTGSQYLYLMQVLPQGYVEYAEKSMGLYAVDFNVTADTLEQIFTYDKTTNAVSASLDFSAAVNALMLPMQTVYDNDGSIEDVIDAYLALIPSEDELTLSYILDNAVEIIGMLEEAGVTFDDAVTMIDAILEESGEDASLRTLITTSEYAEMFEQIKDRKITEAIRGALDLLEEYIVSATDDEPQDPEESVGMETVLGKLYEYMFEKEVDTENIVEDVESYKNIILSLARTTDFNELIDGIDESDELSATIKTVVTKSVEFDTLKTEVTVGFDKNYNIKSVAFDVDVEYTADGGATLPTLPSNDISFGLGLNLKSYAETAEPFEFSYLPGVASVPTGAAAVVCGAAGDDAYSVFYDNCGATITVDDISVYVVDASGEELIKVALDIDDGVVFDGASSSFVFDEAVIEAAQDELGTELVTVYADATVTCSLVPTPVTVSLTYCPEYSADAIAEIPLPIIDFILSMGGAMGF